MATKDQEYRTSIKLKESTIRKLKEVGLMGETYDELINRLLFVKRTGKDTEDETEKKVERLL